MNCGSIICVISSDEKETSADKIEMHLFWFPRHPPGYKEIHLNLNHTKQKEAFEVFSKLGETHSDIPLKF